jgi:hypothetical protein
LVALVLLLAGCGGGAPESRTPARGTLDAILARPGPDVSLVQGTFDYSVGDVRVSFLVVDSKADVVSRPWATVWVGRSLSSAPLLATRARLEPIGIPGRSEAAAGGATRIYVARFRLARPGTYTLVAQPHGAKIQGIGNVKVAVGPESPGVGAKAIPSRTPTLATTHGDPGPLTTAEPPDRSLLRYSIADSLEEHVPFVVTFATPKYCTSRTCGPTVDVVEDVQRRFAGRGVRFIHVEIYRDNDPAQGYNRWFREWRLVGEPFVFLVGRDGRIKARFVGSVSVAELTAAVRTHLLARA